MQKINTRILFLCALLLTACAPTPEVNVFGYLVADRMGTISDTLGQEGQGSLTGLVQYDGEPMADITVLVAGRTGTPYSTKTDADGRYRIDHIPVGQYVPAAVGPGFDEVAAHGMMAIPRLVTIEAEKVTQAPPLALTKHEPVPLPDPLASSINLVQTAAYTSTAAYPVGSAAQVIAFRFEYADAVVDTVRLYLPLNLEPKQKVPLIFATYPGVVDNWETVSVAYAAQGFAFVAISPITPRAVDVDAHALDARVALALAQDGSLSEHIDGEQVVAMGGSFTSAVLHRLLRDEGDEIAAWVTVGGISDAFRGAADFYAGNLEIPEAYQYIIPALGTPHLYPLPFLRYSPVYTAAQLPPTLIIHTDADTIILIDQAYALETAAREAAIPVDVFYYEDVSHYLQIDENMSEQGKEMFWRVIEFAEQFVDY